MFFSGIWFEHHYLVWNITCENDRKKCNVMIKECVPGHCFYVISGFTITAWPRNVYLKLFNWFSIKYIECKTCGKNKYCVHYKGLLRTTSPRETKISKSAEMLNMSKILELFSNINPSFTQCKKNHCIIRVKVQRVILLETFFVNSSLFFTVSALFDFTMMD